jgi:N-acyl amino acid synthase of PEP-CTERM/exosortase system
MHDMAPAGGGFAPYFRGRRVHPELEPAMMQSIFSLRFETYCRECGFLPESDCPDGLESDQHDANSVHFCAVDSNNDLAGYLRLVPGKGPEERFPFQEHCSNLFGGVALPNPRYAVEISRLMVRRKYRRRRGDNLAGVMVISDGAPTMERRNDSPQILLSMFREMYAYSVANDIHFWYAAMEYSLARVLLRLGFAFHPVGPETDYFGPVAPYLANLNELEVDVEQTNPALLQWLRESAA